MGLIEIVEFVIVVCLIFYQFFVFRALHNEIQSYSYLFGGNINVHKSEETNLLCLIGENLTDETTRVINSINRYLNNNHGAVIDYHIIKSIITSHYTQTEDSLESRVGTPLYLGIAGTMIGVIFGLFQTNFTENFKFEMLDPLIVAIQMAMVASLTGLILTTILSTHLLKQSKVQANQNRVDFEDMLQAELLPKIMAPGQSGMSTLALKLDEFGQSTVQSLDSFKNVVENSGSQLEITNELIEKVQNLDLSTVAGFNAQLFDQLKGSLSELSMFSQYYNKVNLSLESTSVLVNSLERLLANGDVIGKGTENLSEALKASNSILSIFNKHVSSFEEFNSSMNKVLNSTEVNFRTSVEQITASYARSMDGIRQTLGTHNSNAERAVEAVSKAYKESLESHKEELSKAYQESVPNFQHLARLQAIEESSQRLHAAVQAQDVLLKDIGNALGDVKTAVNEIELNTDNIEINVKTEKSKGEVVERIFRFVVYGAGLFFISYILIKSI